MKYVTCEQIKDINKSNIYAITLHKVPKIECEYTLVFSNREEYKKFEQSNTEFLGMGAEVRFGKARNSAKYLFKINLKHDDEGYNKCVLVFRANSWTYDNINGIVEKLKGQAENFTKRAQAYQEGLNWKG